MRALALVLALLATPGTASAQSAGTVSIAWGDCHGTTGAATDRALSCASGATVQRLVVTFKPAVAIPDLARVWIGFTVVSPSPWWEFFRGGCRSGALSIADPASVSCANPYEGVATEDSLSYVTQTKYPGYLQFQAHIRLASARELAASREQGYVAAVLELKGTDRSGVAKCSGCGQPACVGVQGAVLYGKDGQSYRLHAAPGRSGSEDFVTWQGGVACAYGTVPIRSRTWGEIKGLYR